LPPAAASESSFVRPRSLFEQATVVSNTKAKLLIVLILVLPLSSQASGSLKDSTCSLVLASASRLRCCDRSGFSSDWYHSVEVHRDAL
jgi:hypothetical protein